MSHKLYPVYPDSFPIEALQVYLDILKGTTSDVPCYVHAGWIVVGYALNQVVPHTDAVAATADAVPYTKAELAEVLEKAVNVKGGLTDWATLIDWKKLAKTVLLLIAERL